VLGIYFLLTLDLSLLILNFEFQGEKMREKGEKSCGIHYSNLSLVITQIINILVKYVYRPYKITFIQLLSLLNFNANFNLP
jgi:lipoate-protein ligase A